MPYITIREATQLTDRDRDYLLYLARDGKVDTHRRLRVPGGKQLLWLVDRDQTIAYTKAHPRTRTIKHALAWTPIYKPASPGQLTEIQNDLIALETWHTLVDLQPAEQVDAIHVTWSDGESFTIAPNGETDHYTYAQEEYSGIYRRNRQSKGRRG